MSLPRIETSNLWDKVYEILKLSIIRREFAPNEKLSIPDLTRQLGVSSTPIREVLKRLEIEGLVRTVPKVGTFVCAVDEKAVMEIIEARSMVDFWIADKLGALDAQIVDNTISRLEYVLKRCDDVLKSDQPDIYMPDDLDMEFHMIIVEMGGNQRVSDYYKSLFNQRLSSTARLPIKYEQCVETVRQHRVILQALRGRDGEALKSAIREHMNYARESTLQRIELLGGFL